MIQWCAPRWLSTRFPGITGITCLYSQPSILPTEAENLSEKEDMKSEYRKLLFWFVGVTSLCAVSMLANFVLVYLQCNTKRKRKNRLDEEEFLFISDEEL